MMRSLTFSWLLKCALTAAAVLIVDRLAAVTVGTRLQQPAATTRDGSLLMLNRYVQEPVPDTVLVGSSVAWRLKEEYFSQGRFRNLALAGGSPLTSLAIVARQARLPKTVLIETNVLSRPADPALVERFTRGESSDLFLRPVRTAVAAFENWNHAPPDPARMRGAQESLLGQPPSDFDNRVYVERAVKEMNADDPATAVRANVARLKELIADIERRGARAFLIAIPQAPQIQQTHAATATREIVRNAFPDHRAWLSIAPAEGELRWADGVHLDDRSALLVARAIEQALAARQAK